MVSYCQTCMLERRREVSVFISLEMMVQYMQNYIQQLKTYSSLIQNQKVSAKCVQQLKISPS